MLTPLSLPSYSVSVSYFILAVPLCEGVWEILLNEFHISYSHPEWYLLFSDSATTSVQCVFGAKK